MSCRASDNAIERDHDPSRQWRYRAHGNDKPSGVPIQILSCGSIKEVGVDGSPLWGGRSSTHDRPKAPHGGGNTVHDSFNVGGSAGNTTRRAVNVRRRTMKGSRHSRKTGSSLEKLAAAVEELAAVARNHASPAADAPRFTTKAAPVAPHGTRQGCVDGRRTGNRSARQCNDLSFALKVHASAAMTTARSAMPGDRETMRPGRTFHARSLASMASSEVSYRHTLVSRATSAWEMGAAPGRMCTEPPRSSPRDALNHAHRRDMCINTDARRSP